MIHCNMDLCNHIIAMPLSTKGESSMLFGFLLQKVSLNSFMLKSNWAGQPF